MSQIDHVNAAVREALPAVPKELSLLIAAYAVPRDTHWAVLPGAERLYAITGAEDRTFHNTGDTPLSAMASAILSGAALRIESNPSASHVTFVVTTHAPGTEAKRVPGPGFTYAGTSGDYGYGSTPLHTDMGSVWNNRVGTVYELRWSLLSQTFDVWPREARPSTCSITVVQNYAGMAPGMPLRFAAVVPPGMALSIIESTPHTPLSANGSASSATTIEQ